MRDRARVVRKVRSSTRTAGGYNKTPDPGPWFRCDFDPGGEPEERREGGFRRRRAGASLRVPRRALDGSEIEIKASDDVEIDSRSHGTLSLSVTGTPERVMQGRVRIGYIVDLAAVDRKAAG
jgi:hypothetical protein